MPKNQFDLNIANSIAIDIAIIQFHYITPLVFFVQVRTSGQGDPCIPGTLSNVNSNVISNTKSKLAFKKHLNKMIRNHFNFFLGGGGCGG